MTIRALFIAAAAFALPFGAHAAPVELKSEIFVERTEVSDSGETELVLAPADRVVPGDKLRFVISFVNASDEEAANFVITNPVPGSIAYLSADGPVTPEVSVDGEQFGALGDLTVAGADGSVRPAETADVTHVRWAFDAIAPNSEGEVRYLGELK
ncbi:MAG: hypothetical protein V2J26_13135 [Pacificimonas sp.]|nr:hypothetical protein [Pacificimonas sp.]